MAAGWDAEDYAEELEPVEIWPENHEIVLLFESLSTQWLAAVGGGMGGGVFIRYGLSYTAAYPLLDRISHDKAAWDENFEMLRVMERAALGVMNRRNG